MKYVQKKIMIGPFLADRIQHVQDIKRISFPNSLSLSGTFVFLVSVESLMLVCTNHLIQIGSYLERKVWRGIRLEKRLVSELTRFKFY